MWVWVCDIVKHQKVYMFEIEKCLGLSGGRAVKWSEKCVCLVCVLQCAVGDVV